MAAYFNGYHFNMLVVFVRAIWDGHSKAATLRLQTFDSSEGRREGGAEKVAPQQNLEML